MTLIKSCHLKLIQPESTPISASKQISAAASPLQDPVIEKKFGRCINLNLLVKIDVDVPKQELELVWCNEYRCTYLDNSSD